MRPAGVRAMVILAQANHIPTLLLYAHTSVTFLSETTLDHDIVIDMVLTKPGQFHGHVSTGVTIVTPVGLFEA